MGMTQTGTPKATYAQREALRKLGGFATASYPVNARTLAVLVREGWIQDGKPTAAGLAQIAAWTVAP